MVDIVERILKLLIYEKLARKTFKKGSTKRKQRLRINDLQRKPPPEFEPAAFRLRTEPLRHLQVGQLQIYSIYTLALFK